ncbi:hypothetical protein DJICPGNB_12420 [Escherichia coli]|nr:hypothetical protein DJICPGNB_12420 [Escherichia coli]
MFEGTVATAGFNMVSIVRKFSVWIFILLLAVNEFTTGSLDIAPFEGDNESRLAVRPYPHQLEEWVELKNGERVP